jgi:hypothetical protein
VNAQVDRFVENTARIRCQRRWNDHELGCQPENPKVAYGPGSAGRHSAQGARALVEADLRARLDDTVGDLALARRLVVGIRTADAWHELTRPAAALRR